MQHNRSLARLLIFALAGIFLTTAQADTQSISLAAASQYIGQSNTVCGTVASITYVTRSKGQPTFINLEEPHPKQIFTAVIWGSDRPKFQDAPELALRGKHICVTGTVEAYRGQPEIIVHEPSQLTIQLKE